MDAKELVYRVVAHTLHTPIDAISDSDELAKIAPDSIALFELLIQFEKITGQSATYNAIVSIETVGDVVTYVATLPESTRDIEALLILESTTHKS